MERRYAELKRRWPDLCKVERAENDLLRAEYAQPVHLLLAEKAENGIYTDHLAGRLASRYRCAVTRVADEGRGDDHGCLPLTAYMDVAAELYLPAVDA